VILVTAGERINEICGQNLRTFATQNYFDSYGVFYSLFISTPILIMALAVVVYALMK
jgi:hypothetical protein